MENTSWDTISSCRIGCRLSRTKPNEKKKKKVRGYTVNKLTFFLLPLVSTTHRIIQRTHKTPSSFFSSCFGADEIIPNRSPLEDLLESWSVVVVELVGLRPWSAMVLRKSMIESGRTNGQVVQ